MGHLGPMHGSHRVTDPHLRRAALAPIRAARRRMHHPAQRRDHYRGPPPRIRCAHRTGQPADAGRGTSTWRRS